MELENRRFHSKAYCISCRIVIFGCVCAIVYFVYRSTSTAGVVKVTYFTLMTKHSQRKCQVTWGITTDTARYVLVTKVGSWKMAGGWKLEKCSDICCRWLEETWPLGMGGLKTQVSPDMPL